MSTTVEEIEKTETGKDTKSELLLDSLEIKGYRCFEHLTIEKLGRVNLIVGENNVGKTALLEALWIYARRGKIDTLLNLLFSRDEIALYFERKLPFARCFGKFTLENKICQDIYTARCGNARNL